MKLNPTTAIILDIRREKRKGSYPVKLRVTYQRRQKYYATGFSMTPEAWDKVQGEKPRGNFKDTRIELNTIEEKAVNVIKSLPEFSFKRFDRDFLDRKQDRYNIFESYKEKIKELNDNGQPSTANVYSNTLKSLMQFTGKSKFTYQDCTSDFLSKYERWMRLNDKKTNTISMYLRTLRTVFNEAIKTEIIRPEHYPFGRGNYQVPASQNIKKALDLTDIEKIFNYPVKEGTAEHRSRDLWIFSYLCNGINIKDIARLKYKNIEGDTITFIRAKTESANRQHLKPIVAILTPESKKIIEFWGNRDRRPESYVFEILKPGLTPLKELAAVLQATKTINKYIKIVAEKSGIKKEVTTYTARHSFSTVLKRSGASIEFISESLGHKDLKTTENYLDSFQDDMKKEWAKALTNFIK